MKKYLWMSSAAVVIGALRVNKYQASIIFLWSFFSIQNNPKNLDPSYKMNLDLWDCLGRVKLVL